MAGDLRYAAEVAREIDRVFVAGMGYLRERGGRDLVARHGGSEAVGALIEFWTSLAWPGRVVSWPQLAGVMRYRDPVDARAMITAHAARGTLAEDSSGFRAAEPGHAFLAALYDHAGAVLAAVWPEVDALAALAGRVLSAAADTGGAAFAAMAPPYEPPGWPAGARLLGRLGTLRYHRADAHAAAWTAAGCTAAEIQAMGPGPRRAKIEVETNRNAWPPFAVLLVEERQALLSGLRHLG
jgi:hypothetical protein